MGGDRVGELAGGGGAGRGEGDVDTAEQLRIVGEFLHCVAVSTESVRASGATARTEETQCGYRESGLIENAQEFLSNSAAGADDSYVHIMGFYGSYTGRYYLSLLYVVQNY